MIHFTALPLFPRLHSEVNVLHLSQSWYHPLNGHEFEQTLEDSEGQGKPSMLQPVVSQSWT